MHPEGRDQNLPDPNAFQGIDQFSDAFAVSRSQDQNDPNGYYSYGNSYIPQSDSGARREDPRDANSIPLDVNEAVPVVSGETDKDGRLKNVIYVGAAALLVCGLGVGAAVVAPSALNALGFSSQSEESGDNKISDSSYEPVPSGVSISSLPVDGWTRSSSTKITLADNASPVTMTNGMIAAVTADGYLYVVDPTTGESVFRSSIADVRGVVTYVSEDGDDALAWRSGHNFYTWNQSDGESHYEFTEDSRLYSSGSLPVVWEKGTSDVAILKAGGEQLDMTIPDGTVPVGVSNGNMLVSASAKNPVWVSDVSGDSAGEDSPITLQAPRDGMVIRKWVGLSNGNIVIVWSSAGEVAASSKVNLTVHSVEDGSVIDTAEVLWGSVSDTNMVPDQTRTKFGIGYTYFDGDQFVSADDNEAVISSYAGDRIYAKIGDQTGEITSGTWTPFPEGTVTPSGIGPEGEAIIKINATGYALTQEGK